MNYLNNAFKKDTNYYIALTLATSVRKIPEWTLDQAAAACNVSKATLNRFCKELGYQNYSRLAFGGFLLHLLILLHKMPNGAVTAGVPACVGTKRVPAGR